MQAPQILIDEYFCTISHTTSENQYKTGKGLKRDLTWIQTHSGKLPNQELDEYAKWDNLYRNIDMHIAARTPST